MGDHATEARGPDIHDTEPNIHHTSDTNDVEQRAEMSEPATYYEATDLEHQTEITDTYIDATDINPNNQTATEKKENTIPNHQHESNPNSTLCIAISKVVGTDNDLIQLNNLHLNIKQMKQSHKYPPHHLVEQYEI